MSWTKLRVLLGLVAVGLVGVGCSRAGDGSGAAKAPGTAAKASSAQANAKASTAPAKASAAPAKASVTAKVSGASATVPGASGVVANAAGTALAKAGGLPTATEHSSSSLTPPPRGTLQSMPKLLGLRFGMTVSQVKAALKKRAGKVQRVHSYSTHRYGTRVKVGWLNALVDPGVNDGLARVRAYFWNDALTRYMVYGRGVNKVLRKKLGRPDSDAGTSQYWYNEAEMLGVACRSSYCSLYDPRGLLKKVPAARARLQHEIKRMLARIDVQMARYRARHH